jgi:hypothetical protein
VPGGPLWSHGYGLYSAVTSVATDAMSDVVVAGEQDSVGGTIDFGCGALPAVPITFVAKLDVAGHCLWSKGFETGVTVSPRVAVDASQSVVVTGWTGASIDLGGGPLAAESPFIVKLDPSGAFAWSQSLSAAISQQTLAVDHEGNIALAGVFNDGTSPSSTLVVEFSPSGTQRWSKSFPGASPAGVAVDAHGNVLVTGSIKGPVDFGGGTLTSVNGPSAYVVELTPTGEHVWSEAFPNAEDPDAGPSPSFNYPQGISVDASGNVLFTGSYRGSVDFGGGFLPPVADGIFVVELDPTGAHLWSKGFEDGLGIGVAAAGSGDVFVTGLFEGTVDFGGGPLTSAVGDDVFVVSFDAGGNYRWGRGFSGVQSSEGIAVDPCGHVVAVGSYEGTIDFGGGALPVSEAAFVAQFVQ